ncbi:hypothetical protein [Aromatoleum diolicum]|uniref:YfdX protein n=1 Tax=Aromatoleum diolicum TaxID=75796 RepID=A0ABX1QBT0_9RHOO|nr:hypothetical protein [Aromatoleum diolicum]NMG75847.1 hypothetical protein [Aromatoleum diolicum]
MSKKSQAAICALLFAGAGVFMSANTFAQAQSGRVAATYEGKERENFSRLVDSAKVLNQALKRVSEQKKIGNAKLIAEIEQKIRMAEAAAADGRSGEARVMLEDAYLTSKLAIVEVTKGSPVAGQSTAGAEVMNGKQHKEYSARMESTKALRDALSRIATEKDDAKAKAEVSMIDKLMRDADANVAQNNARQGRAVLDHAYLRAKVQIERLRGGETLVRTLQFDSKDDEYHYELDRNDTFQMLVQLLVPDESASDPRMKGFLERARGLRSDADGKAAKHEFDDAIKTLEESTGEYQKAIRNAGVMIPG